MTNLVGSRVFFLYLLLLPLIHVSLASHQKDKTTSRQEDGSRLWILDDHNDTGEYILINSEEMEQVQSNITSVLVPLIYLLAFLIGLPSNLLAIWVLLFRTKKFPGTILLINLTLCDLLLLLVLPFRIVYHFLGNNWTFGEPFCRIVIALFYGNMYGSVVCLALIAVDRYIALVHPFGAKTFRSKKNSVYMSVLVWIVVVAAAVPLLISKQSYKIKNLSITTCHDAMPLKIQEKFILPYFITLFSVSFLIPLLVVLFCYTAVLRTLLAEGQRYAHAVRVTVLMLVVFVVCLLPSNVLLLLYYSDFTNNHLYLPYLISLSFSSFNSCIDPFIFYYVSEDFRNRLLMTLCCSTSDSESSSETAKSKTTLLSKLSKAEGQLNGGTELKEF